MSPQPTVLVLGGVGFIGRNLIAYLVENSLASEIRVIDKVLPQTAYLNKRFQAAFEKVEFLQGNLSNQASVEKCFTRSDGSSFDYVINLAAETKFSQPDEIYDDRIYKLSITCAKEAVKRNAKVFVQFSTGDIYESSGSSSKEDSKTKPWNTMAEYKLKVDKELQNMEGLNVIILRPAVVYGIGATGGLTPRLICGRVYQHEKKKMEFLWTKDLRINTVHIDDVVDAIWHTSNWYVSNDKHGPVVFNLADDNDTDQEAVNTHIREIFGIETGFQGTLISQLARLNMKDATEEINETHLAPWSDILKANNIKVSPLTPYLDQELLCNNALSLDGTKICTTTGFKYNHPKLTTESLRAIISDFQELAPAALTSLGPFLAPRIMSAEKDSSENCDNSNTSLPPAYESLRQEISELRVNGSDDKLSELWEKNEFAKTIQKSIEAVSAELRGISLEIHDNPELSYQEYHAHALLTNYLEKKGFKVERKAYGLDTAFVAQAGKSDKVTIGICSEYDALPGIGHACGHNLIAISGVATAIGLKAVIEKYNLKAQVKLFGTPAEETSGGKIVMLNKGAFKDVDVCMMLHGANADVIYTNFLALDTVEVEFFGKASHASTTPWMGVNALDAAVMVYTNIGLMRQQMKPTQRVHGIIKDGGKAANIIPDYTKSVYTVRSPRFSEVEVLKKRVEAIIKSAALATGCRVVLKWGVPYMDILTNDHLARKFEKYMNSQGLHYPSKEEQMSRLSGSTDMGNLTYALPGIHPMFNILNLAGKEDGSMGLHTTEFAAAATQPVGHVATLRAAKSLALTGVECIIDEEFLKKVKKEFEESKY
ncbi:hypothetical protein BGZ76_003614 [Entomortierella beljakovae]|nr:hypothetical protein BGZ76_003614 [Entomortierella beljakovae]